MSKTFLRSVAFALVFSIMGFANYANAELVMSFDKVNANDVRISISGTGVVLPDSNGNNPNSILNFLNLAVGNPFPSVANGIYNLDSNLVFTLQRFVPVVINVNSEYNQVQFNNGGGAANSADVTLRNSGLTQNILIGDTYTASGSAIISGANFSDFVGGTYTSVQGDATSFAPFTSMIVATPEPTTLFLFGSCVGICLVRRRRRS